MNETLSQQVKSARVGRGALGGGGGAEAAFASGSCGSIAAWCSRHSPRYSVTCTVRLESRILRMRPRGSLSCRASYRRTVCPWCRSFRIAAMRRRSVIRRSTTAANWYNSRLVDPTKYTITLQCSSQAKPSRAKHPSPSGGLPALGGVARGRGKTLGVWQLYFDSSHGYGEFPDDRITGTGRNCPFAAKPDSSPSAESSVCSTAAAGALCERVVPANCGLGRKSALRAADSPCLKSQSQSAT